MKDKLTFVFWLQKKLTLLLPNSNTFASGAE
jgi:hypothetical protein